MEIKNCLICNLPFYKKDCKIVGAWIQKKFCSEECRIKYNNKSKYKLRETEHNKIIEDLNKEIKGDIITKTNNKLSENPDIQTKETNYEIELYGNIRKWDIKYNRYRNKDKKHILIITTDKRLFKYFDEIRFYKNT